MSACDDLSSLVNNVISVFKYNETAETILGILFLIVGMAAITGNICALYYFIKIERIMTTSRIFYTAFATTDLVTGIVSCWQGIIFSKGRPLFFCSVLARSKAVCNIVGVLTVISMIGGVNVVALMTVSRAIGVLFPFSFKRIFSRIRSSVMLAVVLLHAVLVGLIPVIATTHRTVSVNGALMHSTSHYDYTFQLISGQVTYYSNELFSRHDEESYDSAVRYGHIYKITMVVFPRMLAIIVMVTASLIVVVRLFKSRKLACSSRGNKIQVSVTLLILAAIFFVTFMPLCIMTIIDVAKPAFMDDLSFTHLIFYLTPAFYLIAFVSAAINPLVYHLRGKSIFESPTGKNDQRQTRATIVCNNTRVSMLTQGSEVRETSNI